jgi:hypothetical protein
LRPRDYQPPFERANPLEHAGHVALGIIAIGHRLLLIAERQAAKEDQTRRIVVLPQPSGRPLAARLFDDRQQIVLDFDVAEERLEHFIGLALGRRPAELDQPAIIAARRRVGPRQRRARQQQLAFPADVGGIGLVRVSERFRPGKAEPRQAILVGGGRHRLPDVRLGRRSDLDARPDARRKLRFVGGTAGQRQSDAHDNDGAHSRHGNWGPPLQPVATN